MHGMFDRPPGRDSAAYGHRLQFAACVRMGRAALGWSQCDLARQLGMTQRAVNRIELGHTEPRRRTTLAIEAIMRQAGVALSYGHDTISVTVTTEPSEQHG